MFGDWSLVALAALAVVVRADRGQRDCQSNEIYVLCGRCEATCRTPVGMACVRGCLPARCECEAERGYVRAGDGACVHVSDCAVYRGLYYRSTLYEASPPSQFQLEQATAQVQDQAKAQLQSDAASDGYGPQPRQREQPAVEDTRHPNYGSGRMDTFEALDGTKSITVPKYSLRQQTSEKQQDETQQKKQQPLTTKSAKKSKDYDIDDYRISAADYRNNDENNNNNKQQIKYLDDRRGRQQYGRQDLFVRTTTKQQSLLDNSNNNQAGEVSFNDKNNKNFDKRNNNKTDVIVNDNNKSNNNSLLDNNYNNNEKRNVINLPRLFDDNFTVTDYTVISQRLKTAPALLDAAYFAFDAFSPLLQQQQQQLQQPLQNLASRQQQQQMSREQRIKQQFRRQQMLKQQYMEQQQIRQQQMIQQQQKQQHITHVEVQQTEQQSDDADLLLTTKLTSPKQQKQQKLREKHQQLLRYQQKQQIQRQQQRQRQWEDEEQLKKELKLLYKQQISSRLISEKQQSQQQKSEQQANYNRIIAESLPSSYRNPNFETANEQQKQQHHGSRTEVLPNTWTSYRKAVNYDDDRLGYGDKTLLSGPIFHESVESNVHSSDALAAARNCKTLQCVNVAATAAARRQFDTPARLAAINMGSDAYVYALVNGVARIRDHNRPTGPPGPPGSPTVGPTPLSSDDVILLASHLTA